MKNSASDKKAFEKRTAVAIIRWHVMVLFVGVSLLSAFIAGSISYWGFSLFNEAPFFLYFMVIAGCGLIVGILCSLLFSSRFLDSLKEMTEVIGRISQGEPTQKVRIHDPLFQCLGEGLNQMSKSINHRLQTLSDDRLNIVTILSSMVEGVIVLDAQGRILLVNHSFERMFEQSENELIGAFYYEKLRHHLLNKLVEEVIKSGEPRSREIKLDLMRRTYFQVQASVAESKQKRSLILVFHDISVKRQQEEIRKDFVANISHELRTPITVVKGYLEALLDGGMANPAEARELLEILQNNCDRMESIVLDLLQISRIESGLNPVSSSPFCLKAQVEKAVDALRPLAMKKEQRIQVNVSPDLMIVADAEKLNHVFTNLIENAIKYTEAHGELMIEANETESEVSLHFRDNGIGIPSQDLPRVFERFYRVDQARSRALGGTGLGLSIVKQIVEAHGGRVSVKNNAQKGTSFTITFPKKEMKRSKPILGAERLPR